MKKILFLFVLISTTVMGQSNIRIVDKEYILNEDSVAMEFTLILNDYRKSHGLKPLIQDDKYKTFTKAHANYMVERDELTHGEGDNFFPVRWLKAFPNKYGPGGENASKVLILPINKNQKIKADIVEDEPILNSVINGTATYRSIAMIFFLVWKHSPSHNELLLDPKVDRFSFSMSQSKFNKHWYFGEFIATN